MSIFLQLFLIPRAFRHLKRYNEIVYITVKYGLGEILGKTKWLAINILRNRKKRNSDHGTTIKQYSKFQRVRLAFEELGPTFVKFGQILSNRPDLLPDSLIKELEKLQKNVAPFPFDEAQKILIEELKEKKDEYILSIDPVPLASGSIAQVHKAILKSGEKVVIKIQRPAIANIIETDIEIMQFLARQAQKRIHELKNFDLLSIINEFKSTINKEIDFNFEVSHIERFQNNFYNDPDTYVPKIFKNICTKSILVMEFIEGYSINDLCENKNLNIDPKSIAQKGANLILKQIFTYGFFHADPHPGNLLILPDSRICFLDYGMTGSLPVKYREFLAEIILGFVSRDSARIVRTLKKFSKADETVDMLNLELQVSELVDEFTFIPLNRIDSTQVLNKIKSFLVEYRLNLPPAVFSLAKSLIIIEGSARKLDPEFNISEYVQPFAKKLISEKVNPIEFMKKNYPKAIDLVNNLLDYPSMLFEISEMLRDGKIRIGIDTKTQQNQMKNSRRNNYFLSLAIFSASAFLTSGLLLISKLAPLWHGLSITGLAGFGISIFILLIIIVKGNK